MTFVSRLIREPLVHFILIGALVFGTYALIGKNAAPAIQQLDIERIALARSAVPAPGSTSTERRLARTSNRSARKSKHPTVRSAHDAR